METSRKERQRQFPSKISTTSFVKLYILHLLNEKPYYGNMIIDEIKRRMDYRWEPSPGMVYPLLRDLEKHGYISGWWDQPNKKSIRRYKITDEGIKHYNIILLQNKLAFEDSLLIVKNVLKDIYGERY
ncbi:MAG: PadR family transcriptional regulator [Tissierellaceae bacterium]|nr:PadR family transcriptional regulator [Tissierellaceae bacterium]